MESHAGLGKSKGDCWSENIDNIFSPLNSSPSSNWLDGKLTRRLGDQSNLPPISGSPSSHPHGIHLNICVKERPKSHQSSDSLHWWTPRELLGFSLKYLSQKAHSVEVVYAQCMLLLHFYAKYYV